MIKNVVNGLATKILMRAMHSGPDFSSDSYDDLATKIFVETNASGLPQSQETIKTLDLHMVTDERLFQVDTA